jgi:hypothetical protein
MADINTNENIRLWFLTCPDVSNIVNFGADYIGEKATECAIYTMPSLLNVYEDVIGNVSYEGKQVLKFIFALRAPYGDDPEQNLDNLQFFDKLKEWVYTQNKAKNFPTISEGSVISIMPNQTQYVVSASADSAVYQMRCDLTYWRVE